MYVTGTRQRHETNRSQFVEASKELIEQLDQLLSAAGRRQLGEAHDVCKQNTARQRETQTTSVLTTYSLLQNNYNCRVLA